MNQLSCRQAIDAAETFNREVALLPKLDNVKGIPAYYGHLVNAQNWYLVCSSGCYFLAYGRFFPLRVLIEQSLHPPIAVKGEERKGRHGARRLRCLPDPRGGIAAG
ncbi:MAG TPA: hypothetical protein VGD98_22565 [Ktedonobacteraceae bacterium]